MEKGKEDQTEEETRKQWKMEKKTKSKRVQKKEWKMEMKMMNCKRRKKNNLKMGKKNEKW